MIRLTHLKVNGFKQLRNINLIFPLRCCVLIEGLNEAGKSSLFESIYTALYGRGLIMRGGGRGQIDSLIGTGLSEAYIELGLLSGNVCLQIERWLYRGRPNEARLLILNPDGSVEQEVRGITRVNEEILAQLNGLDSEALLHSCFVQQKKLGQLEEVGRDRRQAILLKLLDLDRLVQLKERFAWRHREELGLQAAQDRLRLAELTRRCLETEDECRAIQRQLRLVEVHEALDEADRQKALAEQLRQRMREQASLRDQYDAQITYIQVLDKIAGLLERILESRNSIRNRIDNVSSIDQELNELDRIESKILPTQEAESRDLIALLGRLTGLAKLETTLKELQERQRRLQALAAKAEALEEPKQRLIALRGDLEAAEHDRDQVTAQYQRAQQVQALHHWIEAVRDQEARRGSNETIRAYENKAHTAREQAQIQGDRVTSTTRLLILSASLLAIGLGILLLMRTLLGSILGGLFILAGLVGILALHLKRQQALAERSTALAEAANYERQAQDERIRQQTLLGKEVPDLEECRTRLQAFGLSEPEGLVAAEALITQIVKELPEGWTIEKLGDALEQAREKVRQLDVQAARLTGQIENTEQSIKGDLANEGLKDIQAVQAVKDKLERETSALRSQIEHTWNVEAEALNRYDLPRDATIACRRIENRLSALRQEISSLKERLGRREVLKTNRERLLTEIQEHEQRIAAWYEQLNAEATVAQFKIALVDEEAESALLERVRNERARYNLSHIWSKRDEAASAASKAEAGAKQAEEKAESQLHAASQILSEFGIKSKDFLDRRAITQRLPDFGALTASDRQRLEKQQIEAVSRLRSYTDQAQQLENKLYIKGSDLDEAACVEEVKRLELRKAICQYAAPILDRVRDNILQAVLPSTLDYMRMMLPLLTAGRYHDAELDEETYKIRVWDAEAREYIEKEVYSGATQDQFSLALRLGFALAALPQERGARPGFIFLDEPTAGFDGQRRKALIELLTRGELAERFDQIFLVAPDGAFADNPFPNYIRLDSGRVVAENLSQAAKE